MSIGPLLLAIASAVLIIAGVVVMLRDGRAKRSPVPMPDAAVPTARSLRTALPPERVVTTAPISPEASAHQAVTRETAASQRFPETSAEVTIVRREPKANTALSAAKPSASNSAGSAFVSLQSAVAVILADATAEASDTAAEGQRWPSVESRWPLTENLIEQAAARLNDALVPVVMRIGQPGEAGWSFKNRGFGSYRRVVIAGRSVAWLRAETNQEQVITLKVRAHAVEHALLNSTVRLPASDVGAAQLLDALSTCLRPAAEYAAWAIPKQTANAELGQNAWSNLGALTTEAYTIAAGALREANADLTEVTRPTWDPATGRTRWALAVAVANARAADIAIDLDKRSFEISSVPVTRHRGDLGRRRRLDLAGLSAHGLAEGIAASAWPSVAAALEQRGGTAET